MTFDNSDVSRNFFFVLQLAMDRKKMRVKRSKKTLELLAAGAEFEDIVRWQQHYHQTTITVTLPIITSILIMLVQARGGSPASGQGFGGAEEGEGRPKDRHRCLCQVLHHHFLSLSSHSSLLKRDWQTSAYKTCHLLAPAPISPLSFGFCS